MPEPTRDDRRKAFIDAHKHLLAGIVCDAVTNRERSGGDLAIFLRQCMSRIDVQIGRMFDEVFPVPKAEAGPPGTIPLKRAAT